MKLDKIKFARLLNYIGGRLGCEIDETAIEVIDEIIDFDIPAPEKIKITITCEEVNELLRQINSPDGFIPAIKAYRFITGAGLKESKDAIERYRTIPKDDRMVSPVGFGE